MPTAPAARLKQKKKEAKAVKQGRLRLIRFARRPLARELLIFLGFTFLTALMTWPWVTRLRDAVVDPGDPYLISWILWWDYHQTFHDPLHLFDANIFYPLRYTLAFTENGYGIALLFFPLFALGLRPLTVNSVATFLGFAFCGYGAFRLTRTLTNSNVAAWVAGVVFAFIPYRFHLLSQLQYVFTGWMPLTLESLVLFARDRSRKRAAWLGIAFTMNALSCVTWFILTLTPLALSAVFLIVRYRLERDRAFWVRGAAAIGASALALLPFLLPYHYVSKAHGFTWGPDVVQHNSPTPMHWLSAEYRNRFWKGFGDNVPGGNYRLFPGLVPLLLALASVLPPAAYQGGNSPLGGEGTSQTIGVSIRRWVTFLDALAVASGTVAFVSAGWSGSKMYPFLAGIFDVVTSDRALLVLAAALVTRLSLAYPQALRRATGAANLLESIRSSTLGEAFWLGAIWTVTGFLMSLGTNSWFYRVHYDLVFLFRGMRNPSRAAMVACLGLAVLAGLGAAKIAWAATRRHARVGAAAGVALITLALLFELRAAPLRFMRGASKPDELTLRLKETPMRGGLVEFPTGGGELPHLYMLRAADHGKPLINAISTFVPPHVGEIDGLSQTVPIPPLLLDLLEKVPTSYLVIHNSRIDPARRPVYESFLIRAVASGRLRFVHRYGEGDDLYAVVKTEPEARAEGPLPFVVELRDWAMLVVADPSQLVGRYGQWGPRLIRLHLAASGKLPRYSDFIRDAQRLGRAVFDGVDEQEQRLKANLQELAEDMTRRPVFRQSFDGLNDDEYVSRLFSNAGIALSEQERESLTAGLAAGRDTRAGVLLNAVEDHRFVERERHRATVLLHFFGFLRRNPDDPPDKNINGFLFWVRELDKGLNPDTLTLAFRESGEHTRLAEGEKK